MLIIRSLIVFVFALTVHIGLLLLFQVQTCPHTHKNSINFPSKFAGSRPFKDRESSIGKKFCIFWLFTLYCYIFLFFNLLFHGYLNLVYKCDILSMLPSSSLKREFKKKKTHTLKFQIYFNKLH